ncbi:hypothetical protein B5X24_HaOG204217 [Helicoverpa armigera]|nr:hypothetical protein B5X24_HaOG204217 [Helicoverpa armigera]
MSLPKQGTPGLCPHGLLHSGDTWALPYALTEAEVSSGDRRHEADEGALTLPEPLLNEGSHRHYSVPYTGLRQCGFGRLP